MKIRYVAVLFALMTTLLSAEENKPEEKQEIRVVRYVDSDPTKKENRLLVLNHTAYRSVGEVAKLIAVFANRPQTHFVVYGTCFPSDPKLTSEEIDILKQACEKTGVRFTYYPGG